VFYAQSTITVISGGQTDRQRLRERHRERQRQRQTVTETDTKTQRDRERDRETKGKKEKKTKKTNPKNNSPSISWFYRNWYSQFSPIRTLSRPVRPAGFLRHAIRMIKYVRFTYSGAIAIVAGEKRTELHLLSLGCAKCRRNVWLCFPNVQTPMLSTEARRHCYHSRYSLQLLSHLPMVNSMYGHDDDHQHTKRHMRKLFCYYYCCYYYYYYKDGADESPASVSSQALSRHQPRMKWQRPRRPERDEWVYIVHVWFT